MYKVVFAALLLACGPLKPEPDAGTPPADAAKEAIACVPDQGACNGATVCCLQNEVCNPATQVCQKACVGVGSICTVNGDCCSGICSGTCE